MTDDEREQVVRALRRAADAVELGADVGGGLRVSAWGSRDTTRPPEHDIPVDLAVSIAREWTYPNSIVFGNSYGTPEWGVCVTVERGTRVAREAGYEDEHEACLWAAGKPFFELHLVDAWPDSGGE